MLWLFSQNMDGGFEPKVDVQRTVQTWCTPGVRVDSLMLRTSFRQGEVVPVFFVADVKVTDDAWLLGTQVCGVNSQGPHDRIRVCRKGDANLLDQRSR